MKSSVGHQLELLQTQRDKLEMEVKELLQVKREHDQIYESAKSKLKELTGKIAEFEINSTNPIITEHAYLRYLERAKGIDLAELQKEILTAKIIETINLLHSCKIPFGNGLSLVVRNRTLLSITEK